MNSYRSISFTLFTISIFTISTIYGQAVNNSFEAGISVGTTVYQGDLAPGDVGIYKRLKPSISVYGGKWINPYFSVQGNFMSGKITAYDADYSSPAWKKQRNLNFTTSINEITARMVFSPFGNAGLTPDRRLYPYAFAGAGLAFVHVKRDWSGMTVTAGSKMANYLAIDSAHTLPSILPSVPFGAGVRYVLSPRLALFGEATYRLPVSDYLDGFSYVANNTRRDNYYGLSIGINYTFLKNSFTKCPPVKK